MSWKIIVFGIVTVIGLGLMLLSGWVYLLEGESRFAIWFFIGLLNTVGGALNIRRALMEERLKKDLDAS